MGLFGGGYIPHKQLTIVSARADRVTMLDLDSVNLLKFNPVDGGLSLRVTKISFKIEEFKWGIG